MVFLTTYGLNLPLVLMQLTRREGQMIFQTAGANSGDHIFRSEDTSSYLYINIDRCPFVTLA